MVPLTLSVVLTLVSGLGLLLNGYILVVIILTKQVATANNLLVLHLGGTGALLCAVTLGSWLPGAPCALGGFLHSLLHPVVLWTVCGLNCDRYCAISAPLHYGALVNPKKVLCGLAAAWALSLALSAPPLLGAAPYRAPGPLPACTPDWAAPPAVPYFVLYTVMYTVFTLLLPAVLVLICNLKILMIARYHRHRIASAIYEVTLSAQVTITHQRNPFFVPTVTAPNAPRIRNRSALSSVFQIVGSMFLLYFPYYIVIIWQSVYALAQAESNGKSNILKVPTTLITIATSFLTCSPPINGVLYGIKSKLLRKTFQNYWRKKMMKSEMNQEIQARTPSTCGSRRPSITPLSMMNKPCLQRRLSEALLDVGRSSPQRNSKIKRISSDHAWKTGINFGVFDSPVIDSKQEKAIAHTSSCNTLQVPVVDGDNTVPQVKQDETYISFKSSFKSQDHSNPRTCALPLPRPAMSTTNLILQRVFGLESQHEALSIRRPSRGRAMPVVAVARRSPRILITRAFSEESDKSPSLPGSPNRDAITKKYSCSTTTLLERKWKVLRYQDQEMKPETDSDSDFCAVHNAKIKGETPGDDSSNGAGSDNSSAGEEDERRYVSLGEKLGSPTGIEEVIPPEEELLLSWPAAKRKPQKARPNGILHSTRPNNVRLMSETN